MVSTTLTSSSWHAPASSTVFCPAPACGGTQTPFGMRPPPALRTCLPPRRLLPDAQLSSSPVSGPVSKSSWNTDSVYLKLAIDRLIDRPEGGRNSFPVLFLLR